MAFGSEEDNFTDRIAAGVGKVLIEQGVPLRLVGAQVSNMKPDDSVVEAQIAQKAAEARTAAIKTLTDFLDQDPTGTRKMVYRMQVLQELTRKLDVMEAFLDEGDMNMPPSLAAYRYMLMPDHVPQIDRRDPS